MLATEFDRIAMRVANQTPMRYFNDGLYDGTFSHFGLWVLIINDAAVEPPRMLIDELVRKGFVYIGAQPYGADFTRYEFTVPRENMVDAELPPIDPSEG